MGLAAASGDATFNKEMDQRIFTEKEIDLVLNMIKQNFELYRPTEKIMPLHTKSCETLRALMAEQSLEECFDKYRDMYKEITIENTLKILLRCKLVFHARLTMMGIFDLIDKYQKVKKEARKALAEQQSYKLPQKEINELRLKCGRMYNAAEKV